MNESVYDVTLLQILDMLRKRWWIIALTTVLLAVLAFGYASFAVTPTYSTFAKLGVKRYDMSSYQDAVAGHEMAQDDADYLHSNITLGIAADALNEYDFPENGGKPYRKYSADVLMNMVDVTTVENSRFFKMTVVSTNAEETKIVADAVIDAYFQRLEDDYWEQSANGERYITAAGMLIHEPTTPTSPSSPNVRNVTLLGAFVGLVLGCVIVVVMGLCRGAMNSEDWLVRTFGEKAPVLAVIPDASVRGPLHVRHSEAREPARKQ